MADILPAVFFGHGNPMSGDSKRDSVRAREATGSPHSKQNLAPTGRSQRHL